MIGFYQKMIKNDFKQKMILLSSLGDAEEESVLFNVLVIKLPLLPSFIATEREAWPRNI